LPSTEGGKESILEIFDFFSMAIIKPITLATLEGCSGVCVDSDTHTNVA